MKSLSWFMLGFLLLGVFVFPTSIQAAEGKFRIRLSIPPSGSITEESTAVIPAQPDFVERNNAILDTLRRKEQAKPRPLLRPLQQRRVEAAQRRLKAKGFHLGALDGILDAQTQAALRHYQTTQGLPATGELDEATRRALAIP